MEPSGGPSCEYERLIACGASWQARYAHSLTRLSVWIKIDAHSALVCSVLVCSVHSRP